MYKLCKQSFFTMIMVIQILILASCGGGGSSSGGNTPNNPHNTPDSLLPTVEMEYPQNGAINMPNSINIQLRFNEPVKNVTESTVQLHSGSESGDVVQASINQTSENTYVLTPNGLLTQSTTYYVVIKSGITTINGNYALDPTSFYFTTGVSTQPTVLLTNLTNGESGVQVNTDINIQFSTAVYNVNTSTVTLHAGTESGVQVPSEIEVGLDNTYTIKPTSNLDNLTTYYVVLTSGITAVDNNAPLAPTTFNFTTIESPPVPTPPTVKMTDPINTSTIKYSDPLIKLRFSENISWGQTAYVYLHKDSPTGSVIPSQVTAISGDEVTLKPNANLSNGTYFVVVESGFTSINTGLPVAPTNFTFNVAVPTYAYISSESGVSMCTVSESKANLTGCHLTAFESSNAYSVTINSTLNYAYITQKNNNQVLVCAIDDRTGNISNNCSIAASNLNAPTSVAFAKLPNSNKAYITNNGNSTVSVCSISNNLFVGCISSGMGFYWPTGIAFDSNYTHAYITNSGSSSVSVCVVDQSSGALTNCAYAGESFAAPNGLTFGTVNTTNLFVANKTNVSFCSTNSTGIIADSCKAYPGIFTKLNAIVTYGANTLYAADAGNGELSQCTGNVGSSISCTSSGWYTGLTGITLSSNN